MMSTCLLVVGIFLGILPVMATDPVAAGGLPEQTAEAAVDPTPDPMGGTDQARAASGRIQSDSQAVADPGARESASDSSTGETDKRNLPPLTPELANLNLAEDLELVTLDTQEKVFLPAGTYRQILRVPIDSPAMQSVQKIRQERRPEVKVDNPVPSDPLREKKPFWIRYESLEKIKINDEERRGGLDVPVHGPADLKIRLWYAKSENADVASSLFYFIFGGLGYSTANLVGWSAGNTREIPGDFEYRLVRK